MSASDIIRVTTGLINTVNDAVIGMSAAPLGTGISKFQGQLGKWLDLDDADIAFSSTVGTVYGGRFQYVRLSASAVAPVRGQILFWDPTVAINLFQVTSDETVSTPVSTLIAGINLNPSWTPGNYGFIQLLGLCYVKFRATLTTSGAVGCPVYAATAGGADVGFADVLTTDSTAAVNATFLGKSYDTPTGGSVSRVYLETPIRNM